jgi:hypothetical protein
MSVVRAETAVDDVMGGKDFDFAGEVEMHTCSSEDEEELDLLRPAFANWADQVEYEEAQLLAETGERLTLTWEEIASELESDRHLQLSSTASYSLPHFESTRRNGRGASCSRGSTSKALASAYRDEDDELGEYVAMIKAAKARRDRPQRGLPPPRTAKRGEAAKSSSFAIDEAFHAAAVRSATQAVRRTAQKGGGATQPTRGTKRKSRSRSLDTENDRAADDKKTKKAAAKSSQHHLQKQQQKKTKEVKKREKTASEAGRKLFVGGIVFADLEDDTEAREVRCPEEAALLAEVRREVFVDVVLGAFGEIDSIKAEWDERYCHVVYGSRDAAERAFAGLSDHQERRRLCQVEAAALLREEGLPEAAAPLPNFYVRWPKDDPIRCPATPGHRRDRESVATTCSRRRSAERQASGGEQEQEQQHSTDDARKRPIHEESEEDSSRREGKARVDSKEQGREEEEEEERHNSSKAAPATVNAWTLMRDRMALQLRVGVASLAQVRSRTRHQRHHGPSALVLCLLTLYSCILPCVVLR